MLLRYLLEKEIKQLKRNKFLPRLILLFPCMLLVIMPWAASLEIENIRLSVVDNDHSSVSRRLVDRIGASDYFLLLSAPSSYAEALRQVEEGKADLILEIPRHFEKRQVLGEPSRVLIAANAVDGTKGSMGVSYLTRILNDSTLPYTIRYPFNQHLDYKHFMVPALMVMAIVMICGFLPALNIVSEKEKGTIEQINVSPVGRWVFVLSKLLPYWAIGFFVLTLTILLAWVLYGIVPSGSWGLIYLGCLLFIWVISGIGLVVSNYSDTMQQAMFVMWFFMLILILMSGLFTPISSMPVWARVLTEANPLKYFMEIMRMVYLKGSDFWDILPRLRALLLFAVLFDGWAIWSYRKQQ